MYKQRISYADYVEEVERLYKIERREIYFGFVIRDFIQSILTESEQLVAVWDNKGYKDDTKNPLHKRKNYADSHSLQDFIIVPEQYSYTNTTKPYISFEHKDLMKMLIKMTEYQDEMFPQDSKKIANNVKGVSVMDEANPYNEPLDNIYHILNRLNLESNVQDNEFKEINLHNANKLIDDINDKIDNIVKIKEDITKEKEENDEAIILLKNLEESKISVDDVKNTKYITCRFGKIPVNEFTKIQYYRDYEFIFRELNRSKQYVWIVYAGLTSSISEIDNAFSSMSFEPISLPEFAHGKVHEAIDELTEESTAMEQYIAKMDSKLEDIMVLLHVGMVIPLVIK